MAKKDKKPEIRFDRFSDTWEQRKLSDYLDTSSVKNSNDDFFKSDVLSVSGNLGIINQIEFKGRSFAGASVSNYGIVDNGDVVYTKSPLKANPYGIIKTNRGKPGIVSTLYAVYKPKNYVSSNFIQCYFDYDYRLNQYLKPLVNKGAKNDMKVSDDNALIGLVTFPNYEEQTRIAEFFECLDELITLHQRKYDKLVIVKKSMLEKMFPKDGANVPEIRFAGFTDDWEQRKAVEIFRTTADKNHPELPVLSASQEYGMINREETGINISHNKKNEVTYKRVLPGQFVIHLRSFQGGFAHSNVEGITSPAYTVLDYIEKGKHYDYFWKYIFNSKNFIKRLETVTYGIRDGRSISYEDFTAMGFKFPSYPEQCRIGNYFIALDNLITLHQRELEKLKNIKKTMLDKMFV